MAGGDEGVGVDEAAEFGVIISALEIIESRFMVVDIATVAEGIEGAEGGSHGMGNVNAVAPGVVGVGYNLCTGAVQNRNNITLQVGGVVIGSAAVGDRLGIAAGIVGKGHILAANRHLAQLSAVVGVSVGSGTVASARAHAIGVIGKVPSRTAVIVLQLVAPSLSWLRHATSPIVRDKGTS